MKSGDGTISFDAVVERIARGVPFHRLKQMEELLGAPMLWIDQRAIQTLARHKFASRTSGTAKLRFVWYDPSFQDPPGACRQCDREKKQA